MTPEGLALKTQNLGGSSNNHFYDTIEVAPCYSLTIFPYYFPYLFPYLFPWIGCGFTIPTQLWKHSSRYSVNTQEKYSANLTYPTQLTQGSTVDRYVTAGLGWVGWRNIFLMKFLVLLWQRKECCHNCIGIVKPPHRFYCRKHLVL